MTVRLAVPAAEIPGTAETADFFRQVRERLEGQSRGAKAFLPTLRTKVCAGGTERKTWT